MSAHHDCHSESVYPTTFASYSIYWSQLQPEPLTLLIGIASTHLAYEKGARLCAMLIWLASMAVDPL